MNSKSQIKRINIQKGRDMDHGLIHHKREFLAVNVLRLQQNTDSSYYNNEGTLFCCVHDFIPDQDIGQAMKLLRTFGYYDLSKDGDSYMVLVAADSTSEDSFTVQSDLSEEDAIVEAVLKSRGYYE